MAIPAMPVAPVAADVPATPEAPTAAPAASPEANPERLALAKRERATRERERALMAREAKIKEMEAKYETDYIPKSKLKEDPLLLFKDGSLSYDDVVLALQNDGVGSDPGVMKLARENAELKARLDQLDKKFVDKETASVEQTKKMIQNDVKVFLDGKDAEFEALMAYGQEEAANAVSEFIISHYEQTGFLMSEQEAAKKIDDNWIEEGLKFAKLKKVQEKLVAAGVDPAQAATAAKALEAAKGSKWSPSGHEVSVRNAPQNQQASREQVSLRTLTQTPSPSTQATKKLSESERRQRAILIASGQLKV